ncbi:hypothetical protein RSAG8_00466, partial [Rhizoctonia solani AG-8 WAC10335]
MNGILKIHLGFWSYIDCIARGESSAAPRLLSPLPKGDYVASNAPEHSHLGFKPYSRISSYPICNSLGKAQGAE